MAKRGAPFGNHNASKGHKAQGRSSGGSANKGLRAHLSTHVNYGGAKFQAAQRRQNRLFGKGGGLG